MTVIASMLAGGDSIDEPPCCVPGQPMSCST